MKELKHGDILEKDGEQIKVLGVVGEVIFISLRDNFNKVTGIAHTQFEIEEWGGWELVVPDWEPTL